MDLNLKIRGKLKKCTQHIVNILNKKIILILYFSLLSKNKLFKYDANGKRIINDCNIINNKGYTFSKEFRIRRLNFFSIKEAIELGSLRAKLDYNCGYFSIIKLYKIVFNIRWFFFLNGKKFIRVSYFITILIYIATFIWHFFKYKIWYQKNWKLFLEHFIFYIIFFYIVSYKIIFFIFVVTFINLIIHVWLSPKNECSVEHYKLDVLIEDLFLDLTLAKYFPESWKGYDNYSELYKKIILHEWSHSYLNLIDIILKIKKYQYTEYWDDIDNHWFKTNTTKFEYVWNLNKLNVSKDLIESINFKYNIHEFLISKKNIYIYKNIRDAIKKASPKYTLINYKLCHLYTIFSNILNYYVYQNNKFIYLFYIIISFIYKIINNIFRIKYHINYTNNYKELCKEYLIYIIIYVIIAFYAMVSFKNLLFIIFIYFIKILINIIINNKKNNIKIKTFMIDAKINDILLRLLMLKEFNITLIKEKNLVEEQNKYILDVQFDYFEKLIIDFFFEVNAGLYHRDSENKVFLNEVFKIMDIKKDKKEDKDEEK